MKKHLVTCDGCGKESELFENSFTDFRLPEGWGNPSDVDDKIDLCPKCYKNYKKCAKKCLDE